ncbi:Cation transport protein [uncultured archaeon]|nr:Cation transport protein [uncultured archaeon]
MPKITLEDAFIVIRDLGAIFHLLALVMPVPALATIYFERNLPINTIIWDTFTMLVPAIIFYLLYLFCSELKIQHSAQTSHAMVAVATAWLIVALVCATPFILRGQLNPIDAFFESMSGWATNGFTIIPDIEGFPKDLLLFRSWMQFVGGVGFIGLALITIEGNLPALEYYLSGVGGQKITPSVHGTVRVMWRIFLLYALAGIVMLYIAGMPIFDAVCISFSAISTGGFTPHAANIAYYGSHAIEAVLILMMTMGAISFFVHYQLFQGRWKELFRNLEFKYYIILVSCGWLLITLFLIEWDTATPQTITTTAWEALFHVVSASTTTGFRISDISRWSEPAKSVLMFLMYVGGAYGSSAGGIRLLRFAVVTAALLYTLRRLMYPKSAVIALKAGGRVFTEDEAFFALTLCCAYVIIAFLGAVGLSLAGFASGDSLSISLASLGEVGLQQVPTSDWLAMSDWAKMLITLLMWVGRIEIFPLLAIARIVIRRRI